ncbi:hypothetical protein MUB23_09685 [Cuneatibacter sp. NSJ-177]|uniref:hypothetical protein n=1 Tax=Cuneatibacter sp. NSJ-177 TaxID=2931401 RepID=UPI001FD41E5F|nr:hypothetical protein [Cuneatibacter sp. NSJ-177]MCJ7835661.1 hypothetical protein [Cuneatibacter sp. NSJ-177]
MRKWAGGILGAVLLILLAASCAPRYFCSNCGKIFTGTTYCDAGGEKILCLDCAVRYYSPLAPQKEEWSRGRGEGRRQREAFAAEEGGRTGCFRRKHVKQEICGIESTPECGCAYSYFPWCKGFKGAVLQELSRRSAAASAAIFLCAECASTAECFLFHREFQRNFL